MIALLIGAALVHATVHSGGAEPAVSIVARDGRIMASQIAAVPMQRDAVVATLPEGAGEVEMSETVRLGLIRNRYPGARYRLRHEGPVRAVREAATKAVDAGAMCAVTRTAVSAGAYLADADLAVVRCQRDATAGWLGYDVAARSYFARQPIPAGTCLGRLSAGRLPLATKGAELVYRTSEGPVVVEREVVAMQSGRAGHPIFVRTGEGKVLAATLVGAEETE